MAETDPEYQVEVESGGGGLTGQTIRLVDDVFSRTCQAINDVRQGVISAKSVWELFIGVKKVCDKIWQKFQYKVLIMAKIALNKSYGGNNG